MRVRQKQAAGGPGWWHDQTHAEGLLRRTIHGGGCARERHVSIIGIRGRRHGVVLGRRFPAARPSQLARALRKYSQRLLRRMRHGRHGDRLLHLKEGPSPSKC